MLVPNRPRCAAPAQIGCVRCPDTIQVANHLLGRLGGCRCAASLPAWPVVCPVCGWVPALKLKPSSRKKCTTRCASSSAGGGQLTAELLQPDELAAGVLVQLAAEPRLRQVLDGLSASHGGPRIRLHPSSRCCAWDKDTIFLLSCSGRTRL